MAARFRNPVPMSNADIDRFVPVYPSMVFLRKNRGILKTPLKEYMETHHRRAVEQLMKHCRKSRPHKTVNAHQWKRIHDGRAMTVDECREYQGKSNLDNLQSYMPRKQNQSTNAGAALARIPNPSHIVPSVFALEQTFQSRDFASSSGDEDDLTQEAQEKPDEAAIDEVDTDEAVADEEKARMEQIFADISGEWDDDDDEDDAVADTAAVV